MKRKMLKITDIELFKNLCWLIFPSHVMSEYMRMTDTERDQIDQDAQIFMRTCAEAIQQLRTEGKLVEIMHPWSNCLNVSLICIILLFMYCCSVVAHKDIHSPQVKQHREAVLDFIEDYLKSIGFSQNYGI